MRVPRPPRGGGVAIAHASERLLATPSTSACLPSNLPAMRGILLAPLLGRRQRTWPGVAARAVSRGVSLRETPLRKWHVDNAEIVRNVRTIRRLRQRARPRPSGRVRPGAAGRAMIGECHFPRRCSAGVDELVSGVDGARELERAARSLSERYRAGGATASRAARRHGRGSRLPRDPRARDICRRRGCVPPDPIGATRLAAALR